jgi:hypothetical protein
MSSRNPLVRLFINLSPPCGISSQLNVNRDFGASKAFIDPSDCSYDINNNHSHPDYYDTGLQSSEYDVYQ